jgi:hypothetical protein
METNGNGESKINKILESDLAKLIKIVAFTFGIATAWFSLYYKVDSIQNNHLPHIQAGVNQALEDNKKQDEEIKRIDIKIERILTTLER